MCGICTIYKITCSAQRQQENLAHYSPQQRPFLVGVENLLTTKYSRKSLRVNSRPVDVSLHRSSSKYNNLSCHSQLPHLLFNRKMAKKGNTMATKEKPSSDDETKDTSEVTDRSKGTACEVNERKGCACIKVICRYVIPLIVVALGILIATNPTLIARWTRSFAPVSNKVTKYIREKVTGTDGSKFDWQENLEKNGKSFRVLTDKQIQYRKGGKLRLVVAGHVFDVSEAAAMYGEGSGYHGFIGRDGTRAFVSGKFDDEGLIPDLGGLDSDELKGISNWIDFYLNHETYKFIGLHEGWFFDAAGRPTENMLKFKEGLVEADKKREIDAEFETQFPSCNSEWAAESGSRVWCSQMSGGISRDWVGYPRIFNQEGKPSRCACVREMDSKDKRIELYKGCARNSNDCRFKE